MRTFPPRVHSDHESDWVQYRARLYDLDPKIGQTLYFTDHPSVILFGVNSYNPSIGAASSAHSQEGAAQPDDVSLSAFLEDDAITDVDLAAGKYRDARITVRTIDWRYPWLGHREIYAFDVAETKRSKVSWEAACASPADKWRTTGGDVNSKTCLNELGDSNCGVSLGPFTATTSVSTVEDSSLRRVFRGGGVLAGFPDGYFNHGKVTFTTGANAGHQRKVKAFRQGSMRIELQNPFGYDIAAGDAFTVHRGCNGLRSTCRDVYSNIANHRADALHSPGRDAVIKNPSLR